MEFEDMFPNFTPEEFYCPCGGAQCRKVGIKLWFVAALQDLRLQCGFPLKINSAYRCPEHNARVGSKPTSQHLLGVAADIDIHRLSTGQKHRLLRKAFLRFNGVGVYNTFIHLDLRDPKAPAFWVGD